LTKTKLDSDPYVKKMNALVWYCKVKNLVSLEPYMYYLWWDVFFALTYVHKFSKHLDAILLWVWPR